MHRSIKLLEANGKVAFVSSVHSSLSAKRFHMIHLIKCLQDPVSEVMAVLVKRHDVTREVKMDEQLRTQQEQLQRCAHALA